MKARVTDEGVWIPKKFLEGIEEVEIRQENGYVLVAPVVDGDPILQLGSQPVDENLEDASEHHDRYIYNS